ncbi:GNAT family N-acetyltransferase [Taibaiella soli]|uniref:GNAT family N-acetyltransferase n=1 Tax=Taibaiella soli TaxID=1649169 RepID=A0A2W2B651_9BACT|nr:GNAT family N-acetyltransferase [Taibaiella soli]PZF71689.1 GNAT family N-acetyltransferase [Taibaiella soli]
MQLIQAATTKDIPAIRDLSLRIWPDTYGQILSAEQLNYMLDMMYSETALLRQMEEGQQFILISEDDQPLGFAAYGKADNDITWKLHKIYVLPNIQGKGLGKKLLEYVISMVKKAGAQQLILNVNRYNKARQFYERLGFTVLREEDINIGSGYFMNDYVMQLSF